MLFDPGKGFNNVFHGFSLKTDGVILVDEDAFLTNSLNTGLLTSAASAVDDDPKPPKRKAGCLPVIIFVGIVAWMIARAVGF